MLPEGFTSDTYLGLQLDSSRTEAQTFSQASLEALS